jgi:VWFA-related protein
MRQLAIACALGFISAVVVGQQVRSQAQSSAPSAPAQRPSALVFRSGVERVNVDVVVTDTSDKPVTDLTKADFSIVDNGRPQTITDFQYISVPVAHRTFDANASPAPEPDVATNAMRSPNSRLLAIMVDDLHLIESELVPLKRTLTDIVRALPAEDEVALIYVGHSDLSQNFTTDPGRLLKAIDNARRALGLGLDAMPQLTPGMARFVPIQARTTSDTIRNVASSLAGSGHLRRAIIYVGAMTTIDPASPAGVVFIADELQRTFDQAKRSDVPIYTIDPRGQVLAEDAVRGGIGAISSGGIRAAIAANIRHQQEWLSDIALNTGGRAFTNNSNLTAAVHAIVEENGSFYEMAYSPEPLVQDGQFHEFSVKVNRPGMRVRGRQGYVASGASATAPELQHTLDTAMTAGVNVSGLTLHAFAAPLAAGPKGMQTVVTIDVHYPPPADGTLHIDDNLRIGLLALDPDAKVKAQGSRVVHFAGRARNGEDLTLLVDEVVELPSQPLTLRIGVASEQLARAGTVQISVDVPKPSDDRLQMSGIALAVAGAALPAMNADLITSIVPFQPTTSRTFSSADELRVFCRIFWGSTDANAAATLAIKSVPASLQQVALAVSPSAPHHYEGVLDAIVPLKALAPGDYVLEISVRLPGGRPVVRGVPFAVK